MTHARPVHICASPVQNYPYGPSQKSGQILSLKYAFTLGNGNDKSYQPQKKEYIDYALAHPEIATAKLAADFRIGHSTLSGWMKKALQQGVQGVSWSLTVDQQRIKDLEKENAYLREVNEIVKKAHAVLLTEDVRISCRAF